MQAEWDTLFQAALAGDEKSYRIFLTEISGKLRRFIGRRIAISEVEDVLQEVLISIHKARHTYDGTRPVLPWVMAIARFRLTDHLRKHYSQMQHVSVDIAEMEDLLSAPVTEITLLDESVTEEVEKLPQRTQKIIHLMHMEGYTASEVGKQLGMNESAVKVAAHRAYKAIKAKLTENAS
jgi:RNA polymerase sigma-70 factor (ECF subfamily)